MSVAAIQPVVQPVKPARRRDRLQLFTLVFVALALLVMLGAITSQNNMLFWLVGVAIGSIVVSGFVAGPMMMGIRLGALRFPQVSPFGEGLVLTAEIVNNYRRRSAYALRIEARFSGPRGEVVSARTGLAVIRPEGSETAKLLMNPPERGLWTLTSLRVSTTFPFGLSHKILVFEPGGSCTALPARVGEGPAEWPPGDSLETLKQQVERWAEGDVYALREYQAGDPRRLIAWKPSARTGRLVVREQAGAETRIVWLMPKASRSNLVNRTPEAERVVSRTLSIGEHAETRNLRVGLMHPETGIAIAPTQNGDWKSVLAQLGDLEDIGRLDASAKRVVIEIGPGGEM